MKTNWPMIALLAATLGGAGRASSGDAVVVDERDDSFVVYVPAGKAELQLPKAGFQRMQTPTTGAAASPRYFAFEDKNAGVILSGWMEPERLYHGFKQLWTQDRARFVRKGLRIEQEVEKKVGDWDCVFYYTVIGDLLRQANVRACGVKEGAWFDLHLSHNAKNSSYETLEAVLRSIRTGKRTSRPSSWKL